MGALLKGRQSTWSKLLPSADGIKRFYEISNRFLCHFFYCPKTTERLIENSKLQLANFMAKKKIDGKLPFFLHIFKLISYVLPANFPVEIANEFPHIIKRERKKKIACSFIN